MLLALTRSHVVDAPLPVTNHASTCAASIVRSSQWIRFFVVA